METTRSPGKHKWERVFYFSILTEEFWPHLSLRSSLCLYLCYVSVVHMLLQELGKDYKPVWSLRRLKRHCLWLHNTHTHTNALKAPGGISFLCCLLTVLSNPLKYLNCWQDVKSQDKCKHSFWVISALCGSRFQLNGIHVWFSYKDASLVRKDAFI